MQTPESEPSQHFIRAKAVCTAIIRAAQNQDASQQDALLETAKAEITAYNGFIDQAGQNDDEVWKGQQAADVDGIEVEQKLAAFGVQNYLYPQKRQFLQYTTTSPVMHQRLGVGEAG